ncbi:MAG: GTPase [Alphaproteobacteria bacterium]
MATAATAEVVDEDEIAGGPVIDDLPAAVDKVIHRHAAYAAAGGLIPIPLIEVVTSGTIQIRMIAKLCDMYEVPFSENAIKASVATLVGSLLPVSSLGYTVLSFSRAVPVVGPILGLATIPALAAAATWAVGRVFAWHFAEGGTLDDFDAESAKDDFKREFEEGKSKAAS